MEQYTRDFKGIWVPKEIYLNPNLTWTEKLLYCEIDSLDNEDGCFASNEYFAKFLGVGVWTISNGIKKLKQLGLITVINFNGRQRIMKAGLGKITRQHCEKSQGSIVKNHKAHNRINNINNKIVDDDATTTPKKFWVKGYVDAECWAALRDCRKRKTEELLEMAEGYPKDVKLNGDPIWRYGERLDQQAAFWVLQERKRKKLVADIDNPKKK